MSSYKGRTNHKYVNSTLLIEDIEELMRSSIKNVGFSWSNDAHREALLDLVDELMVQKKEDDKIYNYKVYSDHRNNPPEQIANGIHILTIKFRQKDTINQTMLEYIFTQNTDPNDTDLIEF